MRRRAAFTLAELLVVIGIIGILIALLFPVIARARMNAQMTGCANNIKQIYVATLAYCSDNNDTLYYAPAYQDTTMNWPYPFRMKSAGNIDYTQGLLWRYVSSSVPVRQSIFTCPGDVKEPPQGMPTVIRNFSYSFNGTLNWDTSKNYYTSQPNATTTPPLHITAIVSPAHKILIWEEVGPNDGWCACLGDAQDYPSQRHMLHGKSASDYNTNPLAPGGGLGNQGFADGHVEALAPQQIWNNPYYCNLRSNP